MHAIVIIRKLPEWKMCHIDVTQVLVQRAETNTEQLNVPSPGYIYSGGGHGEGGEAAGHQS